MRRRCARYALNKGEETHLDSYLKTRGFRTFQEIGGRLAIYSGISIRLGEISPNGRTLTVLGAENKLDEAVREYQKLQRPAYSYGGSATVIRV